MSLKKNKNLWQILSKTKVFESKPWITIYSKKVKLPSGKIIERYNEIKLNDFVIVYALTKHNKLIVEKQYKPAINDFILTLPKGAIEKNESKLSAAKREFLEETGYKSNNWKKIGSLVGSGSYGCGTAHVYFVKDAYKISEPTSKDLEETKILLMDPKKFYSKIFKQKLNLMATASAIALVFISRKIK